MRFPPLSKTSEVLGEPNNPWNSQALKRCLEPDGKDAMSHLRVVSRRKLNQSVTPPAPITSKARFVLWIVSLWSTAVATMLAVSPIFNAHADESWVLPASIAVLLSVCALGIAIAECVLLPIWVRLSRERND